MTPCLYHSWPNVHITHLQFVPILFWNYSPRVLMLLEKPTILHQSFYTYICANINKTFICTFSTIICDQLSKIHRIYSRPFRLHCHQLRGSKNLQRRASKCRCRLQYITIYMSRRCCQPCQIVWAPFKHLMQVKTGGKK